MQLYHALNWGKCKPMTPKNCPDGIGHGDYSSPLDEDWEILNKEHCRGSGSAPRGPGRALGNGDGGGSSNNSPTKEEQDKSQTDSDGLWSELENFYKIIKFARNL